MTKTKPGILYIVATPIGHLGDMTTRAIETLNAVDCIAVEDTRHSQSLLQQFKIKKPLIALHEHNESDKALKLLEALEAGTQVALISDAGTPLISDPGYLLVRLAHQHGIPVVPIPGPCSIIAALSASGLPTDRFQFEGFLPAKSAAKRKYLEDLVKETRTLIFLEAPHRILETLQIMRSIFGDSREAVVARELTKVFETIRQGTLSSLLSWMKTDLNQQRGEFVILVAGLRVEALEGDKALTPEAEHLIKTLLTELSVKQAASLGSKITGIRKRVLYEYALTLSHSQ